jgi:molecular chaperone GrpE
MSERDEAQVDEAATKPDETSGAEAPVEAASNGSEDSGGSEAAVEAEGTSQGEEGTDEAPAEAEPEVVEEPEPDPLAELQARYDEAQVRLRTVSKAYTDLQKEMKAFRERMEARSKVNSELQAFDQARRFFDPVMNLKRSLQQPNLDLDSLRQGLEMVQRQFMEAMEKMGLEEVPGEGATFDPNVHEALAVTPVTDPEQDGKVLMVHTAGYTVKGKVLQAAQVVIGKHQEPAGEA